MGIPKAPFVRDRIRSIGPGFGWVDHRLVREHYVERCSHGALALYLFLGSKNHLSPRFASPIGFPPTSRMSRFGLAAERSGAANPKSRSIRLLCAA